MADRFRRHLSGWRIAALLPAAALVLAALLAACASDPLAEEYENFLESARGGDGLRELKMDYGTNYEELLARARMDEDISEEEYNELFGEPVPPPPILLNDPPPPIHTSGEPYPPGTFPPELAPFWERTTDHLQEPAAVWMGGTTTGLEYAKFFEQARAHPYNPHNIVCLHIESRPSGYFLVENQLIFTYEEPLASPEDTIEAELRAAGVEFDSITVRTREYYDEQYDPETFYNWLAPDNSRYNPLAALEQLGADLHPNTRVFTQEDVYEYYSGEPVERDMAAMVENASVPPQEIKYQVKLHGLARDVRDLNVPNGNIVREFHPSCGFDLAVVTDRLLQGVYTTFGDDVVFVIDRSRITGPEPPPPPPILLNNPPPPIHTGGAPYPPGTFPPEAVPLWEEMIKYLQRPVSIWNGGAAGIQDYVAFFDRNVWHPESHTMYNSCPRRIMPRGQWHAASQLLFTYEEALDEPAATIEEDLRAAGVEFESITVRTREYYDERYDPETFYNWLAPDNSRFDHFAVLERLGAETHPEVRKFNPLQIYNTLSGYYSMAGIAPAESSEVSEASEAIYQVKLHGFDGDVRELDVTNGEAVQGSFRECLGRIKPVTVLLLMEYMVGGLYTTFGDDLVLHGLEPE